MVSAKKKKKKGQNMNHLIFINRKHKEIKTPRRTRVSTYSLVVLLERDNPTTNKCMESSLKEYDYRQYPTCFWPKGADCIFVSVI